MCHVPLAVDGFPMCQALERGGETGDLGHACGENVERAPAMQAMNHEPYERMVF